MPDAPQPIYDSSGNIVVPWTVTLTFDGISDDVVMTWRHAKGPYHPERSGSVTIPATEPDALAEALAIRLAILQARRLF